MCIMFMEYMVVVYLCMCVVCVCMVCIVGNCVCMCGMCACMCVFLWWVFVCVVCEWCVFVYACGVYSVYGMCLCGVYGGYLHRCLICVCVHVCCGVCGVCIIYDMYLCMVCVCLVCMVHMVVYIFVYVCLSMCTCVVVW